jgi:regulator of sigma E protease
VVRTGRRIRESPAGALALTIERDGGLSTVAVVPKRFVSGAGRSAASAPPLRTARLDEELRVFVRYGPFDALAKAADRNLGQVGVQPADDGPHADWRGLAEEPVGSGSIADYAGQSARLGVDYYIRFMALLSLSLGVLNLLPVAGAGRRAFDVSYESKSSGGGRSPSGPCR